MTSVKPDAALRGAGLRATRPRAAVLDVLREAQDAREHLTAAQIADRVRVALGPVSTQAVYDNLDALVEGRLARRIRLADAPSAIYEARVGDNHHHVVCRSCGKTSDLDCLDGAAPCLNPPAAHLPPGFAIDEAEIVFWGTCAECAGAGADRSTAAPRVAEPRRT